MCEEIVYHAKPNVVYVLHDCNGLRLFVDDLVEYQIYPEGIKGPPIKGKCKIKYPYKNLGIMAATVDGFKIPASRGDTVDDKGRQVVRTTRVFDGALYHYEEYVRKII